MDGWRYYNHAIIPNHAPHVESILPRKNLKYGKVGRGFRYLRDGLQIMIVDMKQNGGM